MSTEHETEPNDRDELRLQDLFDETAPEPETDALQRMARAAAQIPDLQQPWYRRLWSRQPLAMGAMIGFAAFAALMVVGVGDDDGGRTAPQTSLSGTVDVPAPSAEVPEDDSLDELLAFELSDNGDDEIASLDADPLASWEGNDEAFAVDDDPGSALDVLFVDADDEIEMLGSIFDDMLREGG